MGRHSICITALPPPFSFQAPVESDLSARGLTSHTLMGSCIQMSCPSSWGDGFTLAPLRRDHARQIRGVSLCDDSLVSCWDGSPQSTELLALVYHLWPLRVFFLSCTNLSTRGLTSHTLMGSCFQMSCPSLWGDGFILALLQRDHAGQ